MTVVDLEWFTPLPKQDDFLQCTDRQSIYAGGFGSGKTLVGGFKALSYCLQYPGTEGLIGRQTYRALEDTTKKVVLQGDGLPPIIPPELIRRESKSENRVELINGSSIIFRAFQDFAIEKIRSLNLGWFWLDECSENTEFVWNELMGRLRRQDSPRVGFGTTNPNGHDWCWRLVHPDSGQAVGTLVHAPTEENVHLSRDYVTFLRSQPLEWQKRYVDASFDTASGQIFAEWNPKIHVVPQFDVPTGWRFLEGLDHGERNPTCWMLVAVDADSNVWFIDEYYEPNLMTSVHIEAISQKRARWGLDERNVIVCDPSMFATRIEGVSAADAYRRAGIKLKPGVNSRAVTFDRVAQYLHPRDGDRFPLLHPLAGESPAPRMFVMRERCPNLIREMPEYLWKDYSPAVAETREAPEEPRKVNDHAVDVARYLLAELPKPLETPVFREPPPPARRQAVSVGIRDRTF